MHYDLVIKNGYILDPKNNIGCIGAVALKDGKIAEIVLEKGRELKSSEYIDITGLYLCPGLIDCHVHLTSLFGGPTGYYMLAQAGVTTALDFAGPVEEVFRDLPIHGSGLNVGCCNAILPLKNVSSPNPTQKEIKKFVDDSIKRGAFGIKILGGHFPLTPLAIQSTIEYCNKKKVFAAIHAGSTQTGSDIRGMQEAIGLASDSRLYLAHISAYCRGLIDDPILETLKAIDLLQKKTNIFSGSYLATINGTVANCNNGKPASRVTLNCLKMGDYALSEEGLEKAILDGYGLIHKKTAGGTELISGLEGVAYWKKYKTDTAISFPVNRSDVNFMLATARNNKNNFIVDVISTDGGAIPRNLLLERGLSLVKFGAMSLQEMVHKISENPADLLGLLNKGHLTVGADADLTIFDYAKQIAVHSLVEGKFVLKDRKVVGKGGKILLTPYGKEYADTTGQACVISKMTESSFYK